MNLEELSKMWFIKSFFSFGYEEVHGQGFYKSLPDEFGKFMAKMRDEFGMTDEDHENIKEETYKYHKVLQKKYPNKFTG